MLLNKILKLSGYNWFINKIWKDYNNPKNKAIHLYANNVKFNSGDFFIGPATKWKFEKLINKKVKWVSKNIRAEMTPSKIAYINSFDYIL